MVLNRKQTISALVAAAAVLAMLPIIGLPAYYISFVYTLFFWVALATSWGMLSGFTGYWSFGHAAFYGAGIYTTANLSGKFGVPFLLSLPVAALIGATMAAIIGLVVFRLPKLRGEFFALITLSVTFVIAAIISNTSIDGGVGISLNNVNVSIFGLSGPAAIYICGLMMALATLLAAYSLDRSRVGMGLRAIHDDEDAAEVKGVPTFTYKVIVFAISSAIASVAGGIQAVYIGYITVGETFSITIPLYVVLMSILGGARHWFGPAVGALLIATALNSVAGTSQAELGRAGVAFGLVLVILLLPEGILPYLSRIFSRRPNNADGVVPVVEPVLAPMAPRALDHASPVLLECVAVAKNFGGVQALKGVDLQVRAGEILALVGPNGSGKSTLINMITGHYMLTSGEIKFAGRTISTISPHEIARSGISRTYQIPRIFDGMSVRENVAICAVFGANETPAAARSNAINWLGFAGLSRRADARPAELNLQERKFLELARALATKPQLLLLDEVLCGLNPAEIERAIALIRQIRDAGTTIVFVEHLMRVVVQLADRVAVLDQGRLLALGSPRETMQDPKVISAYLGSDYAA